MAIQPSFSHLSSVPGLESDSIKIAMGKNKGVEREMKTNEDVDLTKFQKKKNSPDFTRPSNRKYSNVELSRANGGEYKVPSTSNSNSYHNRARGYSDASACNYKCSTSGNYNGNSPPTNINDLKARWLSTDTTKKGRNSGNCYGSMATRNQQQQQKRKRRATISVGNSDNKGGWVKQGPNKKGVSPTFSNKNSGEKKIHGPKTPFLRMAHSMKVPEKTGLVVEEKVKTDTATDSTAVATEGKSKKGLHAVDNLNFSKDWAYDISSFLRVVRLHKYEAALQRHCVYFEELLKMSDKDLDRVGISASGARKRMLRAIEKYIDYMEIDFKADVGVRSNAADFEQTLSGNSFESPSTFTIGLTKVDEDDDPTSDNILFVCQTNSSISQETCTSAANTHVMLSDPLTDIREKNQLKYLEDKHFKDNVAARSIFEISPRLNSPPLARRRNSLGTWVDLEKAKHLNVIKSITSQENSIMAGGSTSGSIGTTKDENENRLEDSTDSQNLLKHINMFPLAPVDSNPNMEDIMDNSSNQHIRPAVKNHIMSREEELKQFHLEAMLKDDAEQLLNDLDCVEDSTPVTTDDVLETSINDNGTNNCVGKSPKKDNKGILKPDAIKTNSKIRFKARSMSTGAANSILFNLADESALLSRFSHQQRIPSPIVQPNRAIAGENNYRKTTIHNVFNISEHEEYSTLDDYNSKSFDYGTSQTDLLRNRVVNKRKDDGKENLRVGRRRSLTFDSLHWNLPPKVWNNNTTNDTNNNNINTSNAVHI